MGKIYPSNLNCLFGWKYYVQASSLFKFTYKCVLKITIRPNKACKYRRYLVEDLRTNISTPLVYLIHCSYRLGEYPLPALLARSGDTCFVKTHVFYALPKGKPQRRIQKIQKGVAGTIASYIDTFIFLRIL